MTKTSDTHQLNWPRWQQALLIALLVLVIGNRLIFAMDNVVFRLGPIEKQGTWGGLVVGSPNAKPGFEKAIVVTPGGPLANAGVRAGDDLRFEVSYTRLGWDAPGERLNFTLDRGGTRSERQLTLAAEPPNEANRQRNFMLLLNVLGALVSTMIGCFILWRGWGNVTAMLLGAAVAMLAYGGLLLPVWVSAPTAAYTMLSLLWGGSWMIHLTVPFAMRMFEEGVAPLPRWHWRLAMVWLAIAALSLLDVVRSLVFGMTNILGQYLSGIPVAIFPLIAFLICVSYLIAGWRRSGSAMRGRFTLIILALAAFHLTRLVTLWNLGQSGYFFARENAAWLNYGNALMMGLVAPGLLAYAVLRHKLFDLGFAVNRTLVFATVSAVLLVSFGTFEWAVEHLVPESWHEGSAFYSAGIAVGLFLLFHRIRDGVEHVIERLFFRSWHQNEAALKRFVAAAAHVEKPEALAANFTAELARFTGGAAAALHSRTAEGHYASAKGDNIDADDPALTAMRAEQGAVVPAEVHSPLPAALALPMMHQAALAGFVLLGPKPTGEDYRPDEVDILGWATQQVGLDMQAIRVRALELTNIRQAAQIQSLTGIVETAALAGAGGRAQ